MLSAEVKTKEYSMSRITKNKRKVITLETKMQILALLASGKGSTAVGRQFGIHESTIRTIKKNEAAIMKSVHSGAHLNAKASYTRDIVKVKMEQALAEWIEDNLKEGVVVHGNVIKQTALTLYKHFREEMEPGSSSSYFKFSASTRWMRDFRKRHNLLDIKNEQFLTDESDAQEFSPEVEELKDDRSYVTPQVLNTAENNDIYWDEMPDQIYDVKPQCKMPTLSEDIIKDGLKLASKLGKHFVKHDPNIERARKFQSDLNLLMVTYREANTWTDNDQGGIFLNSDAIVEISSESDSE